MRNDFRQALVGACRATTAVEVCVVLRRAVVTPTTVLARFWLIDTAGQLQLAASAGSPTGGGGYNRTDGEFSSIAAGHGKIGQIAATRQPLVVRGVRGDEQWLTNPGWVARQGVRAFIGLPLVAADQVLGVMASFERAIPSDDALDELQFVADFAAARLSELARITRVDVETSVKAVADAPAAASRVMTRDEVRGREKANIEAALAATRGKVFGDDGAAHLLGMRPTTLASRIKALGITRERPTPAGYTKRGEEGWPSG